MGGGHDTKTARQLCRAPAHDTIRPCTSSASFFLAFAPHGGASAPRFAAGAVVAALCAALLRPHCVALAGLVLLDASIGAEEARCKAAGAQQQDGMPGLALAGAVEGPTQAHPDAVGQVPNDQAAVGRPVHLDEARLRLHVLGLTAARGTIAVRAAF